MTNKKCHVLLESYAIVEAAPNTKLLKQDLTQFSSTVNQDTSPCYPSGSVPLASPFYLKRSYLDEQIYQEIKKPGTLIRIKAPREMGKTSLLLRILDY
ncbi:MAG: AAA-like domain-containing protein, partial [Nostoc sp.]